MKRHWFIGLVITLAWLLIGCAQAQTEQKSQTTDADTIEEPVDTDCDGNPPWSFEGEIVIGRVVPSTGRLQSFGTGTPYVEERLLDEINRMGGVIIDGKRCSLRILCADSGSTVEGAKAAAEKLIEEGIDVMITSHTVETVMPVTAICEREGIFCVSTDAPASAWLEGGTYESSWHAFFDTERELLCFLDAWEKIETNRKIGLMTANDPEGIEVSTFVHSFAEAKGYSVVDAGAYYANETDYTEYIQMFKENECDIIMGVMVSEDFGRFWTQLQATDYRPKMCTIAKACLFEEDIRKLGALGNGLITEVWWSGTFPFRSSINGETSETLAKGYLAYCEGTIGVVPPTVGYKYANIEVLYDILTRAGSLELSVLNKCAEETNLDTIVGHVQFNDNHVSYMSCVTGQWLVDADGTVRQEIIGNYLLPTIEVSEEIQLLE